MGIFFACGLAIMVFGWVPVIFIFYHQSGLDPLDAAIKNVIEDIKELLEDHSDEETIRRVHEACIVAKHEKDLERLKKTKARLLNQRRK